jgi:carboxymethylenebutenolidase
LRTPEVSAGDMPCPAGKKLTEQEIDIRTADGTADSVLVRPEGGGRWPGVLLFTDIGGIRPTCRETARRLATKGYTVLMPNVFYRTGRPPLFDFPRTPGDERSMKRFGELAAPLTPEAVEGDAAAYVDFLAQQDSVRSGGLGVVGYCFTGAFAMRAAAVRPDRVVAAASFHGGGLFTDAPTSPHLVLPRIKARLYFAHATKDRSMPEEAIEKLDRALEAWGGKYQSEVYEGAYHSWTATDSPVFNQLQAERAFQKLTELLGATLV